MTYPDFASAQSFLLWSTFAIALIMGAVVNKTNFCTMGAVSDWVNMGDTGRLRAWILAIAIGVLGVTALEAAGLVNVGSTFPPYRQNNLVWLENVVGGVLFGIGMTLASGCGNKTLVRIGGGNLKSVMVLLVIGLIAYFMVNPFPGSDKTLYSTLFYPWTHPAAVALSTNQDLGAMLFGDSVATGRMVAGAVIGVLLLIWAFKSADFRGSFDNILGGLVVGLAVLAAWYVTSNVKVDAGGDILSLQAYVQDWDLYAPADAVRPAAAGPLAVAVLHLHQPHGAIPRLRGERLQPHPAHLRHHGTGGRPGRLPAVVAGFAQLPHRVVRLRARLRQPPDRRDPHGLRRRAGDGLHHRPGRHRFLHPGAGLHPHLRRHRARQRGHHESAVRHDDACGGMSRLVFQKTVTALYQPAELRL